MKNLVLASLCIVSLSGTAFAANTTAPTTTTATTTASANTATISISFNKKATLLATGTITPTPQATDKFVIQWTSPDNQAAGKCHNSIYKIKAGASTFKSHRTPWYQESNGAPVACKGLWTASVVNLLTGNTLATATYTFTASTH